MAIRINSVKSSRVSEDAKEIIVLSQGKYTGELELRFAGECVADLIEALVQASSSLQGASTMASRPLAAQPSVQAPEEMAQPTGNPDLVTFEVPKNLTITADKSGRGCVLMIFNHRLEKQQGYALAPDAARQVAGGLTKSADALVAQKQ